MQVITIFLVVVVVVLWQQEEMEIQLVMVVVVVLVVVGQTHLELMDNLPEVSIIWLVVVAVELDVKPEVVVQEE